MSEPTSNPRHPLRTFLWRLVRLGVVAVLVYGGYRAGEWVGFRAGHFEGVAQGFADRESRTLERRIGPLGGPAVALRVPAKDVVVALTTLEASTPPDAFRGALDRVARDLLEQTARVYPFSAGHDARALDAWDDLRDRVTDDVYGELRTWAGQRAPLPGQRLALTHHAAAQDVLTLLRDRSCGWMREVWAVSTAPGDRPPILPGMCGVVERELLEPWGEALLEAAIALDVQQAVTAAETRSRETIMELATAELTIDAVVRQDYESKLFQGTWVESTSRATLEVRGTGIVKSGFKLDERYSVLVDEEAQRIVVTLPRAKILSNTLVPSFTHEQEGWWASLGPAQRNQAIRALQEKVERQALTDGVLKEAEERAVGLVQDLFSPITAAPGSPYEIEVRFEGAPPE